MDRAHVAEHDNQDREADRGFSRSNRENEENENLAGDVAEKMRERDEVHIHREQHELDGHQQHDQVLPVEEDPDHADREQDRAQDEVMGKRRHL